MHNETLDYFDVSKNFSANFFIKQLLKHGRGLARSEQASGDSGYFHLLKDVVNCTHLARKNCAERRVL